MGKMVQREDEKQAAAAGLMSKTLTQPSIEKHLADFAVDAEAASHTHISALPGGQKVKEVIAAAMWQNPHILILDEPTNYLDRDGLGALALAIKDFGGASSSSPTTASSQIPFPRRSGSWTRAACAARERSWARTWRWTKPVMAQMRCLMVQGTKSTCRSRRISRTRIRRRRSKISRRSSRTTRRRRASRRKRCMSSWTSWRR